MLRTLDYIHALYSLGNGSPFYRHSAERDVPWPHVESPLRNADEKTIDKWSRISGDPEEIRREVKRLSNLPIPKEEIDRPLISNNLYKPNRITYTSILPLYEETTVEVTDRGVFTWRVCDPDFEFEEKVANVLPGHCILHELRLVIPPSAILRSISLKIGGEKTMKRIQSFDNPEETIIPLLQNYLGMSLVVQDEDLKYITIPFFFSREPAYGLPIFAVGGVEVSFEIENIEVIPRVLIDLEVLHSREEVEEIRRTRSHQTEHLVGDVDNLKTPKWIYMNCFWRKLPSELIKNGKARLLHDGGVDEEIKGVFWKLPSNKNRKVKLEFHGDRTVPLINFHPCAILSEIELKTKILPTTSGSFLTNPSLREGYGGHAFKIHRQHRLRSRAVTQEWGVGS